MVDSYKMLPRLESILLPIILLAFTGCASVPKVEPPDPMRLDEEGQVRHFKGLTPDQVLFAAESVLRKYQPEAHFIRETDTLCMEHKWWLFLGVIAGYDIERWVIVVRQVGDSTGASVAMGKATEGYVGPFAASGHEYPQPATWWGKREIRVDYSMFWRRVQSVLQGDPWPKCEKLRLEKHYRYYEPICGHETVNRSNTD